MQASIETVKRRDERGLKKIFEFGVDKTRVLVYYSHSALILWKEVRG